jgi:outer membrane immunogenic protein
MGALGAALALAPAVEAQQFSGGYAGGSIGYEWIDSDPSYTLAATGERSSRSVDADGWDMGLFGGYRLVLQNGIVVGGEVGGLWADAEGSGGNIFGSAGWSARTTKDNEIYASLKAGTVVGPGVLLYGIGGFQSADFELRLRDQATGAVSRNDDSLGGWHLGFGGEYYVSENVTLRGEYKYQSYDSLRVRNAAIDAEIEPSENVLRLGIAYNF